jgi:hypothetical protein
LANSVENQQDGTFGVLPLLVLIAIGVFLWMPAWTNHTAEAQEHTLHRAESLAYQLLETRRTASRAPASAAETELNQLAADEGRIGLDPWGHPYNFKLLKSSDSQKTKILVWSLGPDGVQQTQSDQIDSNRDKESPSFSGDDLGIMVSIK